MIKGENEKMNKSVHELHNELILFYPIKLNKKIMILKVFIIVLNRARRYPLLQEAKRDIQIENKEENDNASRII